MLTGIKPSGFAVLAAVAWLSLGAAEAGEKRAPGWIKDQNGCAHWNGDPHPDEAVFWTGGCENGRADGQSTAHWLRDGKWSGTYVGEIRAGKLDGQGSQTWATGEKYVGQFMNGTFHGQGTHTWKDGSTYAGQWKHGKKHGRGTITWADGGYFIGEFRNEKRWNGADYSSQDARTLRIVDGRWAANGKVADP